MNSELPTPQSVEAATNESDSIREQLAEQKDLNLRMATDFENFKRRNRQESDTRAVRAKRIFHPRTAACN